MKGKDFVNSKWVKSGATPETQKAVKENFQKWTTRVNNTGLLGRAKQLYQFFLSSNITGTQKTLVVGALFYIISPIDLIPDFIPVVGWLDDIGVASFTLSYIFSQMDKTDALKMEEFGNIEETRSAEEILESDIYGTNSSTLNFSVTDTDDSIEFDACSQNSDLQNKLNELADIANTLNIKGSSKYLAGIENRLSLYRILKLAVVGRYSTGKSTLINSFLGRTLLPTSPIPTTSAITYISKGNENSLYSEQPDGEIIIHNSIDDLHSLYDKNICKAEKVLLTLQDFPFDNLSIVDTPGLEDPDQNIAQLTLNALPETDAIVVLLDANYLQSKVEFEFISSLLKNDRERKLFVVINKIDGKSNKEIDHLEKLCSSHLTEYGVSNAKIFSVSAKLGMDDPGFKRFRETLLHFLTCDIQGEAYTHAENELTSYSSILMHACEQSLEQVAEDAKFSQEKVDEIQKKIADIENKYEKQKQGIVRKFSEYRAQFFLDFAGFIDSLKASVQKQITEASLDTLKNTDDIAVKVKQQIVSFVDGKLSEIGEKIQTDISISQNEIKSYLSKLSMHIGIRTDDYSGYSSLFMPSVVVASWFFCGFLSFVWVIIAATVGRNFFESAIARLLGSVGVNRVRKGIIEEVSKNLGNAHRDLEAKLNTTFDVMEKDILASYDTAKENIIAPLTLMIPSAGRSAREVTECRNRLEQIIKA